MNSPRNSGSLRPPQSPLKFRGPFFQSRQERLKDSTIASLLPKLTDYGVKIVGVLVGLYIAKMIANWVGDAVRTRLSARNFDTTLTGFFANVASYGVLVMAVLSCLGVFGIQTTSFAAVIGAAGLAVGLAFQGTLSNFASGVMLLVFRPFKVGDRVNAGGLDDVWVAEIGLFTTSFDSQDHQRIILPNNAVASGRIDNKNLHARRRVDINLGTAYGADIDATRSTLEGMVAALPYKVEGQSHQVFLVGLGASSIDWQLRVWCDTADYWNCWEAVVRGAKNSLEAADIGIPYATMDLNVVSMPDRAA